MFILINVLLFGLEILLGIMVKVGGLIVVIDRVILMVFVVEIVLCLFVYCR